MTMRETIYRMKVTNKATYLVAGTEVLIIEYYNCLYVGISSKDGYTLAISKGYVTSGEAFEDVLLKVKNINLQGVLNDSKN